MAINVSQAFKRTSANPIDESIALTKAEMLTVNDNLMPAYYFTICQDDGYIYLYDKTATASVTTGKFTKFEGGSDSVVEGYRNPSNGLFYEESTYTTAITGKAKTLYVDKPNDGLYWYDGTNFVSVGGGESLAVSSMPTADSTTAGKVLFYIGATTSSYTHNRFYECIEDSSTTPSTYSWEEQRVEENEIVELTQAQYDALTPAQKNNGQAYFINDATLTDGLMVVGNRFDKANIYTDTEKLIGSYLGKPLYQVTFTGKTPATANTGATFATFAVTGVYENIRVVNGYVTDGTSYRAVNTLGWSVWCNSAGIRNQQTDSSWLNKDAVIVVQYTKSTDGTVSIGTPYDYSKDEVIVGTWIDGKPLYQKTIQTTMPDTINTFKAVEIGANVEFIQMISGVMIGSSDGTMATVFLNAVTSSGGNPPIVTVNMNTNKLSLYTGVAGYVSRDTYITIQYTKAV